jgi:GTP-binding protein
MERYVKKVELVKTIYTINDFDNNFINDKVDFHFLVFGKSNVGKSSFINTILNRKNFAKVSKTPGRTSSINFYLINNLFYLIDLPGYGFSKSKLKSKVEWTNILNFYFLKIESYKYSFFIFDIRREYFDNLDNEIIEFLIFNKIPIYYIFNKIDKVSKNEAIKRKNYISKKYNIPIENIILFSSLKKVGIYEVENIFKNIILN